MWGAIAGAALKIGGSIYGGISSANAMQENIRNLEARKRDNRNWYDSKMNEDPTQRTDAQHLLRRTEDVIRRRNRRADGQAVVSGDTGAQAAVAREQNNDIYSRTIQQILAAGAARRDRAEQQYMQRKDQLDNQLNNLRQQKAANTASAVSGMAGALGEGLASI